jgi:hypothetical protein
LVLAIVIAITGRLYPLLTVEEVEGSDIPGTIGTMALSALTLFLIS